MTHLANSRALAKLEQACEAQRGGHAETVAEADRLYRALDGITRFPRRLAGTDRAPELPAGNYAGEVRDRAADAPPSTTPSAEPTDKRWTKTHRPGPHDVLTWQEALSVPWIDGMEEDEETG